MMMNLFLTMLLADKIATMLLLLPQMIPLLAIYLSPIFWVTQLIGAVALRIMMKTVWLFWNFWSEYHGCSQWMNCLYNQTNIDILKIPSTKTLLQVLQEETRPPKIGWSAGKVIDLAISSFL